MNFKIRPTLLALFMAIVAVPISHLHADFVGDLVTVTSESVFSGDPMSQDVTVISPGVEIPFVFASFTLISNFSVDIEASSIDITNGSFVGFNGASGFNGLRFTGLDSPGEFISGFSFESSIGGLSDVFNPAGITFGDDFLNVALDNVNGEITWLNGDFVSIDLQFSVPEPTSLPMIGIAMVGLFRRRRLK